MVIKKRNKKKTKTKNKVKTKTKSKTKSKKKIMTQGRKFKIGKPILEVKNISLSFGGVKAITNISFDVLEHEIRALIGPNGAGKSSLLNCINGIYKPQEGKILFKGEVLDKITPNIIAQKGISRTFQNLALFKRMSVLDNILVGRKLHSKANFFEVALQLPRARREEKQNREKCEEIIKFLEIENIKHTPVGKLPYGLQKKVELGRALATEANVLLLDEPMAGMNVEEKRDMCRFILKVNDQLGTTIVLIEHDMGVVMDISDRVVVLDYGKIIGDDVPDKVRANKKVIDAYLGVAHD
jgi:branched-chain amino acid transport system ATP-binding protein